MLTALQNQKLKLFFQMLDVNHDRFVGAKDFEIISQNFAKLYNWEINSPEYDDIQDQFMSLWDGFLALADRNRDNQITLDEFLENFDRQFESHQGFDAPLLKQFIGTMFDLLNISGTGKITKEEYIRFCQAHDLQKSMLEVGFQKLDPKCHGYISKPEYLRHVREFFCSDAPESTGNWLFVNYQECFNASLAWRKPESAATVAEVQAVQSIAPLASPESASTEIDIPKADTTAIAVLEELPLIPSPHNQQNVSLLEEPPDPVRSLAYIQTKLEPILFEEIGPIASIHLKYAAQKAANISDLIERLSQSIPSSNRSELEALIKNAIAKIMSEPHQNLENNLEFETSPEVPAIAPDPRISQSFIDRCEEELTDMIGPMAAIVLQKAMAVKPDSQKHLIDLLAQQLPSQTHAIMFRQRVSF